MRLGYIVSLNRYEAAVDAERASVECVCDLKILTSSLVSVAWPLMQQSEYEDISVHKLCLCISIKSPGRIFESTEPRCSVSSAYSFVMWLVPSTSHKSTGECWLRLDRSGISGHARPRGCAALYGP